MSISSELSRLQAAKADIAAALAEKGVSVPAGSTLDTFGNLVRQVKTGSTVLSATFSAAPRPRSVRLTRTLRRLPGSGSRRTSPSSSSRSRLRERVDPSMPQASDSCRWDMAP